MPKTPDESTLRAMAAGLEAAYVDGTITVAQAATGLTNLTDQGLPRSATGLDVLDQPSAQYTGHLPKGPLLLLSVYADGHHELATRTQSWDRWSPPVTLDPVTRDPESLTFAEAVAGEPTC